MNLPNAISTTAYNANNQLTQWGTATPTYDANGNTLSDGTNTYVWNARNQLASMNLRGESFQYDPFGRRTGKTLLGTTTNYLYDGANPVQELSGTTPTANMLTGGVDEYFTRTDSIGTANFLTDALGSTISLTNSSGGALASYAYEPFGNTTATGSSTNTYQYTGRENDGTGVYFYRYRYYSPTVDRFISQDPLGLAAGPNLYAYALDNPVSLKDPFGLWTGQVGISGSATVWGWGGAGSIGIAVDSNGGIAWYWSWGGSAGTGEGIDGSIGINAAVSNAQTVNDLAGPFANFNISGGDGLNGTIDTFGGPSAHGCVTGAGVTAGLGLGGSVSESITKTYVHPLNNPAGRYSSGPSYCL